MELLRILQPPSLLRHSPADSNGKRIPRTSVECFTSSHHNGVPRKSAWHPCFAQHRLRLEKPCDESAIKSNEAFKGICLLRNVAWESLVERGANHFLAARWQLHISKFPHSDRPDVLHAAFQRWLKLHANKPAQAYCRRSAEAAVRAEEDRVATGPLLVRFNCGVSRDYWACSGRIFRNAHITPTT